jgi:hypothetical protein
MMGSIVLLCGALVSGAPQAGPAVPAGDDDIVDAGGEILAQARERDEAAREEDEDASIRDRGASERDLHKSWRDRRRLRFRSGDRGDDEGEATGRASGRDGAATLQVKGPVTLRLRVQSGEAEVVLSDKPQVAATVTETRLTADLQLVQYGDRVELEVGGHPLRRGHLRIELPKGSNLEFDSTSADVSVQRVGGDVRVRTMSGDVKVAGARKADVETISGDVSVEASANVRLHTVSGNATATTTDPAVQLDFESASGNLDWSGICAKGCHLATETVSGDIKLAVDPKSSFELAYSSHSGDLRDDLKLEVKRAPKKKQGGPGGWIEAIYGKGEGVIECDAFSGDVHIRKK